MLYYIECNMKLFAKIKESKKVHVIFVQPTSLTDSRLSIQGHNGRIDIGSDRLKTFYPRPQWSDRYLLWLNRIPGAI